jgi:hypothetical protein
MPRYAITERAGPFVAAHRNTGVGTVLDLTERQAEHELRLGTLAALPILASPKADEPPTDMPDGAVAAATPPEYDLANQTAQTRKRKRSAT